MGFASLGQMKLLSLLRFAAPLVLASPCSVSLRSSPSQWLWPCPLASALLCAEQQLGFPPWSVGMGRG